MSSQAILDVYTVEYVVIYPIATLSVMYFTYGVYVLLFGTATHLLWRRISSNSNIKLHLPWVVVLFVISTSMVVVQTTFIVRCAVPEFQAVKEDNPGPLQRSPKLNDPLLQVIAYQMLPVISNAIADSMLIHRCHIIWGSNFKKPITYPLIAMSIITTVMNFASVLMNSNEYLVNRQINLVYWFGIAGEALFAAVNLILTLLTAGRIWWIMWRARVHNNPLSKYGSLASINRIILESGMIYPISIVVHLSTSVSVKTENIPVDLLPIIVLIAGIAPTLIVVRTSMGQSIVNEMQTTSETFTSVRISDRIGSHTIDEGRIVPSGNAVGQGQSTV
ncbi:hypothetical protein Moror_11279 [Moniliophthora roreri MCA 2997]|uniref:Uncharacterized protein n=1 Tax=Moniliophthora roreri (strain MCA 2997) TaxID=1381753 RepID=V2X1R1_MONRO|nr:hypothetical protein Moror_11279 [Moniliophthora roreri MCA 2997]